MTQPDEKPKVDYSALGKLVIDLKETTKKANELEAVSRDYVKRIAAVADVILGNCKADLYRTDLPEGVFLVTRRDGTEARVEYPSASEIVDHIEKVAENKSDLEHLQGQWDIVKPEEPE